jgi:hypothetical protein
MTKDAAAIMTNEDSTGDATFSISLSIVPTIVQLAPATVAKILPHTKGELCAVTPSLIAMR